MQVGLVDRSDVDRLSSKEVVTERDLREADLSGVPLYPNGTRHRPHAPVAFAPAGLDTMTVLAEPDVVSAGVGSDDVTALGQGAVELGRATVGFLLTDARSWTGRSRRSGTVAVRS